MTTPDRRRLVLGYSLTQRCDGIIVGASLVIEGDLLHELVRAFWTIKVNDAHTEIGDDVAPLLVDESDSAAPTQAFTGRRPIAAIKRGLTIRAFAANATHLGND